MTAPGRECEFDVTPVSSQSKNILPGHDRFAAGSQTSAIGHKRKFGVDIHLELRHDVRMEYLHFT